jgi:hypothetical protein
MSQVRKRLPGNFEEIEIWKGKFLGAGGESFHDTCLNLNLYG